MTLPLRISPSEVIAKLRAKGTRITKARSSIIEIFQELAGPISVLELQKKLLARKLRVNKTTVYRELAFLLEAGVLSEIDLLDGRKRYEFRDEASHHHHLVCTSCQAVQCVELPDDLRAIEAQLTAQYQFRIKSHVLEFFGLCRQCVPAA